MSLYQKIGIYQIKNIKNNKKYIGSAINIGRRWKDHKYRLNNNKHCNNYLQNSWNKHGRDAFEFKILEEVNDKNKLIKKEQYFLDKINPEYNICYKAHSILGLKRSEKTKEKISKAQRGKLNHNYGKKASKETRKKMSEAQKGRKITEETREKMSEAQSGKKHPFYGKKLPLKTRKKMSEAHKGENNSNVKLTQKDVIEIRNNDDDLTQKELAKMYNVARITISRVVNKKSWVHV